MKQIRKRLTYANVMSSIAVFLVLGGSAFAATQLAKNSVGSKQLKKNAVTAAKIKNNAVTAGKLKNGAVTGGKLANGAVTGGKLANGAVTNDKIGASAVGTGQLAEGSVGTGKLADGAVNSGKLAAGSVNGSKLSEAERSQAFVSTGSSEVNLPEKYGDPDEFATVLSLNVPSGNWVLNAHVAVAVSVAEPIHVICRLNQGATVIAQGGLEAKNLGLFPSINNVHLSGFTTAAGTVTVTCADNAAGGAALARNLVATRVASVTG